MEDGGRLSDSDKVHKAEMEITDGFFLFLQLLLLDPG